jgi:uncharacterized protein YuzE
MSSSENTELVMVPCDIRGEDIIPVTIHATTRHSRSTSGSNQGDSAMGKTRMTYFEKEDILHLSISDEHEASSVELTPTVTAELNEQGELIGIEILRASGYVRDSILESVQARMLQLSEPGKASS